MSVSTMLKPENLKDLASMIQDAGSADHTLVPTGGATATSIGNRGSDNARVLDLTALSGVTSYQPADLTVSVAAGTRVSELFAELATNGQELPIDVPFPETATIGGLVASGFAGSRRLGSGTLKDLILGCTYVRGDALVAKAGGSVVKNVSGFEIPRLLHGSWGSLAVLASINFKVTPKPKFEVTLTWPVDTFAPANQAAHDLRGTLPSVTAIDVDRNGNEVRMNVRLMGRPGALTAQIDDLKNQFGDLEQLEAEASRTFWQQRSDRLAGAGEDVQVVLTTRPRFIGEAVERSLERLDICGQDGTVTVSPGVGSARIRFNPEKLKGEAFWPQLDSASLPGTASAIVEFAPDSWKQDIDVWGTQPGGIDVMRSIKAEFDPRNVLNRGRLFI
jgi:glycolate oxidase FAD binding subunit